MSDSLGKFALAKFKERVTIETVTSLEYLKDECNRIEQTVLIIRFPCECLKSWYNIKSKTTLANNYIQILNAFLTEKYPGIKVREDCSRLEGRLRRLCSETKNNFQGKTGNNHQKLSSTVRQVEIRKGELVNINELEKEVDQLKDQNKSLEEENESLQKRCDEMYNELLLAEALEKESQEKLKAAYVDLESLKNKNNYLHQYLDKIEEQKSFENTGGKISEVKERQQRRKLRELKTAVEKSLWFAKTLGLKLNQTWFTDEKGGNHKVDHSSETSTKSFKDLPEEEQEKVKCVLFLTDKFCISEAAYHEFTMTSGGENLPRSYLIRQCKEKLNELCHIIRTPGAAEGAQLIFEEELKSRIKSQQSPTNPTLPELIRIKISGDGARMTRMTNFVVISYSLLDTDDVMSSKGNHTVAVIKGHESYDLLKSSCKDVFGYVNKLLDEGKINIDGKDIPVDVFLGGDYKFLLLVLGMKGATSDFACIWCMCHKKDRHDMSKPMGYYWEQHSVRTIGKFEEWARQNKFSCAHPPLLRIPLQNVILDELHLMLRITDNLLTNLVQEALEWDKEDNHNKPPSLRSKLHLDSLIKAINSCGVCFNVWEKKNADGKGSATYDFTSLMGSDKKLLIRRLPAKLDGILKPETSSTVIQLWKSFEEIYNLLNTENPSTQQITEYFLKANKWVTMFTSLGSLCPGYIKDRITPYMHSMVYHVPQFMTLHKGIKKFSGQGVEKKNDDCRRLHLQKSNKLDATKDVLVILKRQEHLHSLERTARTYTKRRAEYWENEIKEKRAKQKPVSPSQDCENNQISIDDMSPADLRNQLKDMGITTRVRNIKKLQQMYNDAMLVATTN